MEYNFKFILREHEYNQNMKKLSNIYSTFTNYDNLDKSILNEIFQAKIKRIISYFMLEFT